MDKAVEPTEDATVLDFCVEATSGNHLFEMYGAEDCCDGTHKWSF